MKKKMVVTMLLAGLAALGASAQEKNTVYYRTAGPGEERAMRAPIVGAPYTATVTNESVQVLADGNRIVQNNSGTVARDSQGRTRQDAPLPPLGNMAAANAPHLVFITDPVGQKTYTLNLTEKTAETFTVPSLGEKGDAMLLKMKQDAETRALPGPPPGPGEEIFVQRHVTAMDKSSTVALMDKLKAETMGDATEVNTEDLGSQVMEGVLVTGTRTTKTIAAGHIGNEKPIHVVIEVWTSPELHTVVLSKRSDPRTGEQTFKLTNIVRGEPDAALFAVPGDFRVIDGSAPVLYKMRQ